jgi:hypothetical protein
MRKLLLTLLVCGALTSYAQNDYFSKVKNSMLRFLLPNNF